MSGSVPGGEALAKILSGTLIEASRGGCSTEADRCGAAGESTTNQRRSLWEIRQEHPRPPSRLGLSRSLIGEVDGQHGVKGLHWILLD
jgi:hypothetical protein